MSFGLINGNSKAPPTYKYVAIPVADAVPIPRMVTKVSDLTPTLYDQSKPL